QILGEATKDARTRADEIAANSGCSIGEVRQAQMGVIQITQPDSTEVSGYGRYDTSTIDKDVSVVVSLTLGIE
ncbi:MAG TPA: SIMPL domain-containing protein, partial [Pseudomonadota bacterium]|nr:SIMPL domain-containing protein [Pseudomonadota bacterium]